MPKYGAAVHFCSVPLPLAADTELMVLPQLAGLQAAARIILAWKSKDTVAGRHRCPAQFRKQTHNS
jgi:hypothetical protein